MKISYKKLSTGILLIGWIITTLIFAPLLISYYTWSDIVSRSATIDTQDVSISQSIELKTGSFTHIDTIHYASWDLIVRESDDQVVIEFQENFSVANGPDLYIHLSGPQEYGNAKQGSIENTINLGKISSKEGRQTYVVTKEEWEKYNHSILIWCRAFGIHFSHAILD